MVIYSEQHTASCLAGRAKIERRLPAIGADFKARSPCDGILRPTIERRSLLRIQESFDALRVDRQLPGLIPVSRPLTDHSRSCAASSIDTRDDETALLLSKYFPDTPATSSDEHR